MRVLLVLCALLGCLGRSFAATRPAGDVEPASARAYCVPDVVQIGEPFHLYLDIVHDPEQRVLLHTPEATEAELFGDSYQLLEASRSVRLPLGDGSGKRLTQVRWQLFALEPGEFSLPTLGADCVGAGAVQLLEAPAASLTVRAELVEGEDEARAALGFREAPDVVRSPLGGIVIGTLVLLGVLFLSFLLWLVRRFKPAKRVPAPPTPLVRLQELDPSQEGAIRDLYFDVSHIVREALDPARAVGAGGTTDEEWVAHLRDRHDFPPELLERTAGLLESCAAVKYGAAAPTRWAAEELLKEANAICSMAERGLHEGVSA